MATRKQPPRALTSFDDLDAAGIGAGYAPLMQDVENAQQQEVPVEPRGALRAVSDTAVQFGKGAVSGVRMMSDVFGADNAVSGGLRSADEALSGLLSATAKQDQAQVAAIMEEAEGKGWIDQIGIGLKAAGVSPAALLAQAAGTALPTLAASALTGGAAPAAMIARLGMAGAMGGAQGVGATKGAIYDNTKQQLLKAGASPEEAEARAVEQQSYGGDSSGQIALGGGLGVLAGSTGAEKIVAGLRGGVTQAAPGIMRRMATGGAVEAMPEFLQGGQEKYATNSALNNEGFEVDPMSGVVANATMEGVAGAGVGAGFGILSPAHVPDVGPLSRAANAGIDAAGPVVVPPAPSPLAPEQEQTLLDHANARAREIEQKAKGTKDEKIPGPDGKPITVPGLQPEFLTPAEKEEQAFLAENGGDAQALAQAYPGLAAAPSLEHVPEALPIEPAIQAPVAPPASAAELPKPTPEAFAQREADRPSEPVGAAMEGDILNNLGKPFKTMPGAMTAQKKAGDTYEIVRVADGLVVRQKASNGTTDGTSTVPATGTPVQPDQPAASMGTGPVDQPELAIDAGRPLADAVGETGGLPGGVAAGAVSPDALTAIAPFKQQYENTVNRIDELKKTPVTQENADEVKSEIDYLQSRLEPIKVKLTEAVMQAVRSIETQPNDTPATSAKRAPLEVAPLPDLGASSSAAPETNDAWTRMQTADREAVIGRTDLKPNVKKNILNRPWNTLNKDIQGKLTAAMATPAVEHVPEPQPAAPKKSPKQRAEEAIQARADYFTPGNIVQGYSGHDRVISYKAPDGKGEGWNVTVQAVVKQDGQWVVDPKDNRVRTHSTHPDARELAKGPAERVKVSDQKLEHVPEKRSDPLETPSEQPTSEAEAAVDALADDEAKSVADRMDAKDAAGQEPTEQEDGIVIKPGKGFIVGKFISEVDGDGVPGGPFDTEDAAREAAEAWRTKKADRATESAAERARRDAMAEKIKAGAEPTAGEIKSLDLAAGESDIRWFFPTAANLFGLTSRQIRPIVAGLIRVGQNDMGTKRELVPTKKALMLIGKSLTEPNKSQSSDADAQGKPADAKQQPAAIEDFGEKILGARKDYATLMSEAESVDISAEPLSKSWPEPDYQKLLDGGADPFVAAWVHASRDEIPTKPQSSWKVATWAAQVKLLRDVSFKLLNGEITKDKLEEKLKQPETARLREHVGSRAELYQAVGHEKSLKGVTFLEHHYSLYKGEKNVRKWVIEQPSKATAFGNWPREIVSTNTRDEALNEFKQKYASLDLGAKGKTKPGFIIYRKRGTDGAFVGKKIGREYIDLHKATDIKAARDYLEKNADALEALLAKYKDTPYERNEDNAPRVGGDHRNGAPVTPEVFSDTFGFRGVQFGNYVEQGRRQSDLNEAFDALMDMAAVLGLPPKAISLNGRLGLAFGARGKGGKNAPAAHYESGHVVINLTKGGGPGSLAHEWFHAMDNYFAKEGGASADADGSYMTGAASGDALREEMRGAFKAIKRAVQAGALKMRSEELDKRRSKPYWATPIEMAARSFESYIIAKLQDQNASNDYLANIVSQQAWDVSDAMRLGDFGDEGPASSYPYPTVDEMPVMRAAFDDFFKTVQTKETDKGVAMFSRGASGDTSPEQNALQALSENDELFALPKSDKDTLEGIAADTDPGITVKKLNHPGLVSTYILTMPDGGRARLMVRKVNPYGAQSYGMNASKDGETNDPITERPGNNADSVPDDTENVYIDVSALKEGGQGKFIYNIAATLAHNTGRILIGDPGGLSDIAMRRRTEHMLASALKFGTTQHLAPHPRQVDGASGIGVPPLRWTYGDDLGNIESLIQTSLKSFKNATADRITFEPQDGTFRDSEGRVLDDDAIQLIADKPGQARPGNAGSTTYKRSAVLGALLREQSQQGGAGGKGVGILGRILENGRQFPASSKGIFYSRGANASGLTAPQVTGIVDAIKARWGNAPDVVVVENMTDAAIPQAVRDEDADQQSKGAAGEPEGFYYRGKVYVVASTMHKPGDVSRVLFHEALGHAGLRGVFGDSLKPILQQLSTLRKPDIVAKAWAYGLVGKGIDVATSTDKDVFASMSLEQRLTAAEEVLAVLAQTKPEIGYVQRAVAAIRAWLRANVPGFGGMKLTDADIISQFILPARRFIEGGNSPKGGQKAPTGGTSSTPVVFSRSDAGMESGTSSTDAPFNRAVVSGYVNHVADKLNETFSHPGKLSLWHRTVGSMFNLAERSAPFKRVFNAAQNFINDVSYYAAESADMAPKILPKLDTWRDMLKTPISAADNKAIAKPILEGTLSWARDADGKPVRIEDLEATYSKLASEEKGQMLLRNGRVTEDQLKRWQASTLDIYEGAVRNRFEDEFLKPGVVWSDAELKTLFKLEPAQIGLYREFRAAIDKSLDNLAKADLLRFGGKDTEAVRELVMDAKTADDAAVMLRDYLNSQRELLPERADELAESADGMIDRADKVNRLKKQGYAPLSRFGRYSVDVVVDGKREYFNLFESAKAANQMAARMKQTFGADNVAQGTMSQKEFEQFQGITPESLELFGNMLGLDATGDEAQDKAFQTYLKLTKSNRSAMKRMIHRQGIAGYSEDMGRVLAAFVYSNARQTSAALHMGELGESVQDIPKGQGELKDAALEMVNYIKQPREEAQALRGLLFAQYLGGSVASAFVNFTQPLTVSFPYLSQYGGAKKAGAALLQAMNDQRASVTLEADLAKALRTAEEAGVVSPQSVHELMAQAQGRAVMNSGDGTRAGDAVAMAKNNFSKLALGWGKLFGLAEQVNRRSTFIAAYRIAVEQKITDPAGFATKAVNETQFISNKANKAKFARGAIGATLMTFKSYSVNYLELLHRMATQNGPEGKKAAALMLAMLMLMAGAGGLPFEEDLEDVADSLAQWMGYNFSTKKAKQEFLEGMFGPAMAQFIDKGISGLPGSPIDVSGRMAMNDLIPGTGFLISKRDHTGDAQELLGPTGDLIKRAFNGGKAILAGDFYQGAKTLAPKAIYNMAKGADMASSGNYNDDKGFKVIEATPFESAMKAMGFQPASVAQVQEANYLNQRAKDFYSRNTQDINARLAKGIYEKDPGQIADARAMVQRWNENNPEQRIKANMPAILKRVKEMRKSKEQRVADTAPKAMRAQMRKDMQERVDAGA